MESMKILTLYKLSMILLLRFSFTGIIWQDDFSWLFRSEGLNNLVHKKRREEREKIWNMDKIKE
ncbi:hypothetical protein BpHYR1_045996 [Brachionus plicatilis]|uniref:Uncharacterized protein n=1 Tax=Brachionus plicatilis TaxID=10195 RepID=A0A3M7SHR1_BRAPC|nr:hypothetical protein BpHYR1_045996 [Brachionus plicatilis]